MHSFPTANHPPGSWLSHLRAHTTLSWPYTTFQGWQTVLSSTATLGTPSMRQDLGIGRVYASTIIRNKEEDQPSRCQTFSHSALYTVPNCLLLSPRCLLCAGGKPELTWVSGLACCQFLSHREPKNPKSVTQRDDIVTKFSQIIIFHHKLSSVYWIFWF